MALPPLPLSPNYAFGYLDESLVVSSANGPGQQVHLEVGESYSWTDENVDYRLTLLARNTDADLVQRYRRGPMMVGRSPYSGTFELSVRPDPAARRGVPSEIRTVEIGS